MESNCDECMLRNFFATFHPLDGKGPLPFCMLSNIASSYGTFLEVCPGNVAHECTIPLSCLRVCVLTEGGLDVRLHQLPE